MVVKKYELFVRESPSFYGVKIKNSFDVYEFATEKLLMHERDRERVVLVAIDTKGNVIGYNDECIGWLNGANVHPREALKFLILCNASSCIMIHNHPSGDTTPSNSDIEVTQMMGDVCKLVGIELIDHVIVSNGDYTSMKDECTLQKGENNE